MTERPSHSRPAPSSGNLELPPHGRGRGTEAGYEILEGDPAGKLVELAELRDADLLVVGNRGVGLAEVLLGSVAIAVIRRSTRPVVVVRDPDERRREEEAAEAMLAEPGPAPA